VAGNGFALKGGAMKNLVVVLFTLAVVIFFQAEADAAQTAPPAKIGVVDLQNFQKNSKVFQKTEAVIKKRFEDLQKSLDQERDSLAKFQEDLKKQSMMLSLDAQEDKRRELEKKQRQYKYHYDEANQEMKDTQNEALKKTMQELTKIVTKIGEKEGFSLILERRTMGLIYYNEAIDITDRVTEAYDKSKQ
jgi:outer membrane protein